MKRTAAFVLAPTTLSITAPAFAGDRGHDEKKVETKKEKETTTHEEKAKH